MTAYELNQFVKERYDALPDYPWDGDDSYVFRHRDSRKWFALVMKINLAKLGIDGGEEEVVNLKVDPIERGSLLGNCGVYPAYHMNREHWVTVLLSQADDNLTKWLIGRSFVLSDKKTKRVKKD